MYRSSYTTGVETYPYLALEDGIPSLNMEWSCKINPCESKGGLLVHFNVYTHLSCYPLELSSAPEVEQPERIIEAEQSEESELSAAREAFTRLTMRTELCIRKLFFL